ncbi:MAG: class I SAM-dependent methyltransferase [Bacteroidales bacterium]
MRCRLCNSEDLDLFYKQGSDDQFHFYRCRGCRLVNLDLDTTTITSNQEKYAVSDDPPTNEETLSLQSFRFVKKYVKGSGKYLDIGCGYGALLKLFKEDGWEVEGLELSPKLAEYVTKHFNISVRVANFLNDEQSGDYDLVSLRHVLEHLPDSVGAMKKLEKLVKPGGHVHLEFPNIDGIPQRIKRLRNRTSLFKKKYDPQYVPGHCNEFSAASFEFLLSNTKFSLIRWETYSKKTLSNFLYNHFPVGSKVRVILKRAGT